MRVISHLTYVLFPQPRGGDYTKSIQYTGSHEKAGLKISIPKTKIVTSFLSFLGKLAGEI